MNVRGYIGDKGSGKTLAMVWMLNTYAEQGYTKIFSNLHSLKITGAKHISLDTILDPKNREMLHGSIIGIDELYRLIDTRMTMADLYSHIDFSYFVLQIRKLDAELLYTSQQLGLFDKRVRENTDYIYECRKLQSSLFNEKDGDIIGSRVLDGTIDSFPPHTDSNMIVGRITALRTNTMKNLSPIKKIDFWVKSAHLKLYSTKEVIDPYDEDEEPEKYRLSEKTKKEISKSANYRCCLCDDWGGGATQIHHILPKHNDNERNFKKNLILLCEKHHMFIDQFNNGMTLSTFIRYYDIIKKYRKKIGYRSYRVKNIQNKIYLYKKE